MLLLRPRESGARHKKTIEYAKGTASGIPRYPAIPPARIFRRLRIFRRTPASQPRRPCESARHRRTNEGRIQGTSGTLLAAKSRIGSDPETAADRDSRTQVAASRGRWPRVAVRGAREAGLHIGIPTAEYTHNGESPQSPSESCPDWPEVQRVPPVDGAAPASHSPAGTPGFATTPQMSAQ